MKVKLLAYVGCLGLVLLSMKLQMDASQLYLQFLSGGALPVETVAKQASDLELAGLTMKAVALLILAAMLSCELFAWLASRLVSKKKEINL